MANLVAGSGVLRVISLNIITTPNAAATKARNARPSAKAEPMAKTAHSPLKSILRWIGDREFTFILFPLACERN